MRNKKVFLLVLCIAFAAGPASAETVKRNLLLGSALMGGAAIYQSAKKQCHPVKDPDTGMVNWFCVRGPLTDTSGATLKNAGTYQLRKALNAERTSSGMPPDPDDCDAHHIVPKGESRKWAQDMVQSARDALNGCVDIDAATNGVYLPNKKTGGQCTGSYHKTLHTQKYYSEIEQRLTAANRLDGCGGVQNELEAIKSELVKGKLW